MKPVAALLLVFSILFYPGVSYAQEFNFERAYNDYIFTMDVYEKARSRYILERARYFQSRTLTSETDAIDATADFIQARNDAIVVYLRAIRVKVDEVEEFDAQTRARLQTRLDDEIKWHLDYKSRIRSAGTLEELTDDNKEAMERYFGFTEPLAFEFHTSLAADRIDPIREEFSALLNRAKAKADRIREAGDHSTANIERWIIDTDEKFLRSIEKDRDAEDLLSSIQASIGGRQARGSRQLQTMHNQAVIAAQESLQFLKETGDFMREIVHAMRERV